MMKCKNRKEMLWRSSILIFTTLALSACSDDDSDADSINADTSTEDQITSTNDETTPDVGGLDLTMFSDGALTSSEIVDCELSDGTQTQCYELVTTALNKETDPIGPFCPRSTTETAENAGIWLDGTATAVYEADGNFILDLPNIYGSIYPEADQWIFYNDDGSVNVTDTLEGCIAAARPDVDPAYQSHCVECNLEEVRANSDTGLVLTFTIPVTPVVTDTTSQLTGSAGISLSGFQLAAAAPVQDILSNWTIAAFDDCGGHVNPNDGYHYHAATAREGCNSHGENADGHPTLMGYAMDGYPIHGPLTAGDAEIDLLDECLGTEDSEHGYHYHASSPEKNQHIACYRGLTVATGDEGGGGPDFTTTAEILSGLTGMTISADDINGSLGTDGPPDCDDILNAATLFGITAEEFVAAEFPVPPGLECDFI